MIIREVCQHHPFKFSVFGKSVNIAAVWSMFIGLLVYLYIVGFRVYVDKSGVFGISMFTYVDKMEGYVDMVSTSIPPPLFLIPTMFWDSGGENPTYRYGVHSTCFDRDTGRIDRPDLVAPERIPIAR